MAKSQKVKAAPVAAKLKASPAAAKLKVAPPAANDDVGVAERVYEVARVIEDEITAGILLPGQRLDERKLAERFGVSRTPIREVLLKMSSLGIVELRRNQGAFVTELSSARLIGMLEVLAELKVLAAKQSARRMTLQERQRLSALCDEMTAAAEKQELQQYFDRATELHEVICEGTHNSFLLDTTRNVQICLCAYRRHLSRILHMPIQTSLKENRNIVDAIVTGDAAAAEKWMRQQTELRREEFADLVTLVNEKAQAISNAD